MPETYATGEDEQLPAKRQTGEQRRAGARRFASATGGGRITAAGRNALRGSRRWRSRACVLRRTFVSVPPSAALIPGRGRHALDWPKSRMPAVRATARPALVGRTPSGSHGASACHRHRARRPSRIRRREHRRRVAQLPAAGRRLSAAGSRPASRHSGARPRVGRPAYARTRRVATSATAASVTGASVVSVVVLIVSALRDLPLVAPNAERARALWGGARATRNVHVSAPDGRGGSIAGVRRADSLGLVRSTGWPRSSRIAIARRRHSARSQAGERAASGARLPLCCPRRKAVLGCSFGQA